MVLHPIEVAPAVRTKATYLSKNRMYKLMTLKKIIPLRPTFLMETSSTNASLKSFATIEISSRRQPKMTSISLLRDQSSSLTLTQESGKVAMQQLSSESTLLRRLATS